MRKFIFYPFVLVFLLALSCNTTYEAGSVQYSNCRINDKNNDNSAVTAVIKPYGDSVTKLMRTVIGNNDTKLEKSRQLNTLGYFIDYVKYYNSQDKKLLFQMRIGSAMLTRKAFIYNNIMTAGAMLAGSS